MEKCIQSVLDQTYAHFEVILVNDGSTDTSGQIGDRFSVLDERIKIYHQTNQGPIIARRNGLAKATGDYYLFLDSDDYWDIDLLETIHKAILDYDCDMIIFNYRKVFPNKVRISKPVFENLSLFDKNNKEKVFEEVIRGGFNNLWYKVIKSNILDHMNYSKYQSVKNGEDLLQSLPLLYNAEKILYLDKAMYNYNMNPASITNNFDIHMYKDIAIVRSALLSYMQLLKMDNKEHLNVFYCTFAKNILRYISDLVNSKANKQEKRRIFHEIKNAALYGDALNYIESTSFSREYGIRFFLFKNKRYHFLFLYEKALIILKKLYHLKLRTNRRGLVNNA